MSCPLHGDVWCTCNFHGSRWEEARAAGKKLAEEIFGKKEFTPEDFEGIDTPGWGPLSTGQTIRAAEIANAKIAPLVAELARYKSLWELEAGRAQDATSKNFQANYRNVNLEAEITALKAKLEKVLTQDRVRGYPTGAEWIALIEELGRKA